MERNNYFNNWIRIKLKDYIISLESGKRPKGGAVSEGIPSLGGEHIDSNGGFKIEIDKLKYVPREFYEKMKSGIIKKRDILVVKDGATTGKVAHVDEEFPISEACINEHVFLIRTTRELNSKYLFYYLRSSLGQRNIINDFRGATVGGISKDFINFDMLLPSLEIQKKIVEVLEKAESAIEKRKESIRLVDELVKSRFIEMFGNIITNSYNWDTVKLKDISMLKSGGTPTRSKPEYFDGDIPWITTVALGKNLINENDAIEYITQEAIDISATKLIQEGSLLFGMRVGVGKISVNTVPMCTNQDIMAITDIDTSKYNLIFLKKIIESYSEYFNNQKRGATIQGIKSDTLKEISIPIVEVELQNKFADFVKQVDKLKFEMEKSLKELENNFNSLMQRAFNGELFN